MKIHRRSSNTRTIPGFTLIELLVVIAIIGLLSSVVLSSLNSARLKASDAAVRQQVLQLRTLMNQEYSDTGSFQGIKLGGGWKAKGATCSTASFTGNYASQAANVCTGLVTTACDAPGSSANCVYFQFTNPNSNDKFTIMAYLAGASAQAGQTMYFCAGSSGAVSISPVNPGAGAWTGPGCYSNP